MGFNNYGVRLFLEAKDSGAKFTRTLTLGRQELFVTKEYVREQFTRHAITYDERILNNKYADDLLTALGCSRIDNIDFSDYEGASIIHDLNKSIPSELYRQFDFVFDGGTLEHVFNFPQAVKNCMQMVKVGGYFAAITPANNQLGHGFYQFSPELHYRVFSPENGFSVMAMFIATSGSWYKVADPAAVKSRVTLCNSQPVDLLVLAKRTHEAEIFDTTPQQSDYAATWTLSEALKEQPEPEPSAFKKLVRQMVPKAMRDQVYTWRNTKNNKRKAALDIGVHNPYHFTKVDE